MGKIVTSACTCWSTRRYRHHGVWLLPLILLGCAHESSWENKSEVNETVEQISQTSIDAYLPPEPLPNGDEDWFPEKWRDAQLKNSEELATNELVYQGAARDTLHKIARQGDTITLVPLYTAEDLSGLGAADRSRLRQLTKDLKDRDGLQVRVVGHASSVPLSGVARAKFKDNTELSKARAVEVAQFLRESLNLSPDAVTSDGVGDSQPISRDPKRNRRVEVAFSYRLGAPALPTLNDMPKNFTPWWRERVMSGMNGGATAVAETIEGFYVRSLQHSNQIRVFSDIPLIRETAILEAEGAFDPHLFMEARFRHADEPVGSTLKTGGPSRFEENEWRYTAGLRKRTFTGADVEVSQRIGGIDNNSVFFVPQDQGRTELAISVTQPLLNRAGIEYNRSTIRVATIDHQVALDEFQRQVESHLLEVARAYWSLYLERGTLLIKTRLVDETAKLATNWKNAAG